MDNDDQCKYISNKLSDLQSYCQQNNISPRKLVAILLSTAMYITVGNSETIDIAKKRIDDLFAKIWEGTLSALTEMGKLNK